MLHKSRFEAFAAGFLALTLCLSSLPASPASLGRASRKTFVYNAQNVPLADLLRDFAGAQGLPLVLADGIAGTANANFKLEPEAFLDTIGKAFNLIWYFDGVSLYIYPSQLMQTRLFKIKRANEAQLKERLAGFGLGDHRFPFRTQPGAGLLLAVGPPRHIELVEAMMAALLDIEAEATPPEEVRAFALVYASAVDRKVGANTTPGVASLLAQVYGKAAGEAGGADTTAALASSAQAIMAMQARLSGGPAGTQTVRAAGQDAAKFLGASVANKADARPVYLIPPKPEPPHAGSSSVLSFTADEGINTVFVRGPASQMAEVARVIARLDTPTELVELDATIIDITSDEAEALGFDWGYRSGGGQLLVSPVAVGADGATVSSAGFNITTLLAGGGAQLLARLRAIEARGHARIVSRPKVLGAANRTAVLSDTRTASVRVAGNQDARLYSVEAGTTLRVTPRIILDPAQTRIGLDLFIEDGGFASQTVDQVPLTQRTTIQTEATLVEGQSLLVGGIDVESTSSSRSGVPWLANLPFIGAAFRVDESASNRRQRLFLITPRRVQNAVTPQSQASGAP